MVRNRLFLNIQFSLNFYCFYILLKNVAQLAASLAVAELFVFWKRFDEGQLKLYN